MKLGLQTHNGAESQSQGTIQLVPESWKMAIIIPRRRGGTWEGVPVTICCNEWICRTRGGLVHRTIMNSAALSLPLLQGACSRSYTDNISKLLVLYQNLQFFPVSNFSDYEEGVHFFPIRWGGQISPVWIFLVQNGRFLVVQKLFNLNLVLWYLTLAL